MWSKFCLLIAAIAAMQVQAGITPSCLGEHSLSTPTPMPGLVNCPQYRDLACCSLHQDSLVIPNANGTMLYNFNWDECGPLSSACTKFFQAESCYFECDPYQAPWNNTIYPDPSPTFTGIPMCADYCSDWFEACKNDYTCGTEWLIDFAPVYDSDGDIIHYKCADGSQCKTFGEIYSNAQGLCDVLWGGAFHYSEDYGNCVTWDFGLTRGNPNQHVNKIPYTENFCNTTYMLTAPPPPPKTPIQPQCLSEREFTTPTSVSGLKNCPQYGGLSCCGVDTDAKIKPDSPDTGFLGYNWTSCGPMSPQCEKFFVAQACYFECDPYLAPWANPTKKNPNSIIGVPVCESYCDQWFDACKNELTCGNEWLADYSPVTDANGKTSYVCMSGNQCHKFSDLFDNSRALCDVLWGGYYHFSEDQSNCITWDFAGNNPHQNMAKLPYAEGYCEPKINQDQVNAIVLGVLFGVTFIAMGAFIVFLIIKERKQTPVFGEVPMKKFDQ